MVTKKYIALIDRFPLVPIKNDIESLNNVRVKMAVIAQINYEERSQVLPSSKHH